ncbi:hypothetical protein ART_0557 [Arthrobacter sp. PAMC 25486]|uniref:response regulator transcription factor n=1 Tax=Arthrobacter sp. PAMC 25486 TaxID=1494608 RepID=UPI0005361B12|nr:response regulator transcription factor [Arthrobacter sp. PAMC 25486]AIY00156.1 hypothetical protein ART_0557 [Arthrobacter sp. PAMC 25486]
MGGTGATKINTRLRGRVIVLTTFNLGKYAFGGLSAGASAFLLKSTTPDIPTQAMRTVAGGESAVEQCVTRALVEHCVRTTAAVGGPARPGRSAVELLSRRRHDVFPCIATGLSNTEINQRLYLTPTTAKNHINRILAKPGMGDRVQTVLVAYTLGLVH